MNTTTLPDSTLAQALLQRCARAINALGPLTVADAVITTPRPSPDRDSEFGMLVLNDGSAGLYYAWLAGEQAELPSRVARRELVDRPALELATRILGDSDIERSIGIAAVNAITQALYRAADFEPGEARDSFGGLALAAPDCLGMVGNFRPLVRRARELGIRVHIVEQKPDMVSDDGIVRISLDPGVLADCNKIICTGATLLTDSLDDVLKHCVNAEQVVLLGPTVSCFADDFFARGIARIGGTYIADPTVAARNLRRRKPLGVAAHKTLFDNSQYPGFEALLTRAGHRAG